MKKDRKGNPYSEFDWIRITDLGNRIRINAVSNSGKVKQGPEILKSQIGTLIQHIYELEYL